MENLLTPYVASEIPDAHNVLVLAPHPDDEVFGCGGALALHVMAGTRVHVVVCTSGDAAGISAVREAESQDASRVIGYVEPVFWGMPDRGLRYGEALVQRIHDALRMLNASVVYSPSLWENHPDHRAIAMASMEAVRRSSHCQLMFYEVGAPLRPNLLIDITPVLDRKRAAMACFPSQLALQRYDRHIEALNVFRSYTLSATVEAAEAYERYDAAFLRSHQPAFFTSEYRRQQAKGLMAMPEDTPLISVLIRSMDRPELDKALDSVAAQTWPRVEVVVVNAKGPGHRPLPVWCGRFPMRLIDSDQPLHRSAAANRAMECANGTALLLLDDDDWLDADHLHKLATALQERPDAVAAVTGTRGVDADGVCIHQWNEPALGRLMLVNQMPIMSVLFRKNTTTDAPRFDAQLDLFEDWDFWLQVRMQGEFINVPGVSATYLIHSVNGSGVHEAEPSRLGQAKLRDKWRGRWPDAWLDALRIELEKGSHQTHTLRAQFNDVMQQRDALQIAVNGGAQERIALQIRLDDSLNVLEALRCELDNGKQQAAALQTELDDQVKKVGERDAKNACLITEKEQLIKRLAVQGAEHLAQIELVRVREQEQKSEADNMLTSVKKQRNNVTHELLLARQELHQQSHELARLRNIQIETALRVQTLVDSTSWRVTSPMRSLSTGVRKLRGL